MKLQTQLIAGLAILSLNTSAIAAPLAYGSNETFISNIQELLQGQRTAGYHGSAPRARLVINTPAIKGYIAKNLAATVMIMVASGGPSQPRMPAPDPKNKKKTLPGTAPQAPEGAPGGGGAGSGAIITSDGYIVTNHHVVDGGQQFSVILNDGQALPAKLIGIDAATDLAVLKIEGNNFPTITWGDKRNLMVGDDVVAIGSPFGEELRQTVTQGIISQLRRQPQDPTKQLTEYTDHIQMDAAINPGNSGGPLFHAESGEFIGVNEAIIGNRTFAGISLAIPAYQARYVAEAIIKDGKVIRGSLGVSISALTPEVRAKAGAPQELKGVAILEVPAASPNAKSGLAANDVVVDLNGVTMTNMLDLRWTAAKMRPGSTARITVWRKGQRLSFDVTSVLRPDAPPQPRRQFGPGQ